ncbi:MAG TPA: MFS transporter [Pyrinomonadaceae bacterium]|jgi:MFS family permease
MQENFQTGAPTGKATSYAWYALVLLTLVYTLNFLDRQIIYILFQPIKQEMALSDSQLALIGTTAFVIFYTALGIPFGWLADKGSRKTLIAVGLVVWSLFSGLTGFATDFWTLFGCRLMVGVGEATLGPAAISLLSDYFPPTRRATVTSIYSMGIAVGAGLAAFLGGWIGQNYGWRWAFYLLGFPGVVIAVLVFLLREPSRSRDAVKSESNQPEAGQGNQESVKSDSTSGSIWQAIGTLLSNKLFILLCLGYALLGLATNNLSIWGAVFYTRVFGLNIATIGFYTGIFVIVAGIPATLYGGVLADWFRRRRSGGRMFYGAILCVVSIPFWLVLLFAPDYKIAFAAQFILLAIALAWLGAAAADATEIAGANRRGLAVAIYFFAVNIAAYAFGSFLIGKLNDLAGIVTDSKTGVTTNGEMMRYTLLVCPISCLLGGVCLWLGSRILDKKGE